MPALAVVAVLAAADLPEHKRGDDAAQAFTSPNGSAVLWLNPAKWTWVKSSSEDAKSFIYHTGLAQARFISKPGGTEPERQLEDALAKIRENDPEARLIFNERRLVNGAEMLCIQIETALSDESKAVYYGYLYGDESRTIQAFVITEREILSKHFRHFTALLDGLTVEGPQATFP